MALPEKIDQYIRNLKFKKKAMGGIDEMDALSHIKNICDMYAEELANADGGGKAKELEEQLAGKEEQLLSLKDRLNSLTEEKENYRALAMNTQGDADAAELQQRDEQIRALQGVNMKLIQERDGFREQAGKATQNDAELKAAREENARLKEQSEHIRDELQSRLNMAEGKAVVLETELKELTAENEKLKTGLENAKQTIILAREKVEAERREAEEVREKYTGKYNEIKELSEYIPQIKRDAKEKAEAEAAEIISKANMEAYTMRMEAEKEKERITGEIDAMKAAREDMKNTVLDVMGKYDALFAEFKAVESAQQAQAEHEE